jgi:hypothetical protein
MTTETDTLPLIRTKQQRPRLPGDQIPRRRLLDRLQAGSDRKLILISAMAGAGKTTLLAQCFDECLQTTVTYALAATAPLAMPLCIASSEREGRHRAVSTKEKTGWKTWP